MTSRRVDYIFTGRGDPPRAEPVHSELAFRTPGDVWPSDHFGLVSDLAL